MKSALEPKLYFDRNIGRRVPEALASLGLPAIHHHTKRNTIGLTPGNKPLFVPTERDDAWLKFVGERQWIVFSQDRKFHRAGYETEISAIKQYAVGCFYVWGAEATSWEKMRAFCRAYENIVEAINTATRPFIFDVNRAGRLTSIDIS